jgi:hypothetical protein
MINRHLAISVALATAFSNPLLPRQRTAEAPNRGQARRTHVSAAPLPACYDGQDRYQLSVVRCPVQSRVEMRSDHALH